MYFFNEYMPVLSFIYCILHIAITRYIYISMQLQNTPCTAQVAGHTSDKSHPAQLRGCSATILAAENMGLCLYISLM